MPSEGGRRGPTVSPGLPGTDRSGARTGTGAPVSTGAAATIATPATSGITSAAARPQASAAAPTIAGAKISPIRTSHATSATPCPAGIPGREPAAPTMTGNIGDEPRPTGREPGEGQHGRGRGGAETIASAEPRRRDDGAPTRTTRRAAPAVDPAVVREPPDDHRAHVDDERRRRRRPPAARARRRGRRRSTSAADPGRSRTGSRAARWGPGPAAGAARSGGGSARRRPCRGARPRRRGSSQWPAARTMTAVTRRRGGQVIATGTPTPAATRAHGAGRHAADAPHAVEALEDRAPVLPLHADAVRVHRRVHRRVEHAQHEDRERQRGHEVARPTGHQRRAASPPAMVATRPLPNRAISRPDEAPGDQAADRHRGHGRPELRVGQAERVLDGREARQDRRRDRAVRDEQHADGDPGGTGAGRRDGGHEGGCDGGQRSGVMGSAMVPEAACCARAGTHRLRTCPIVSGDA